MPLCGVYLLMFIKAGLLDITIEMIKKVIYFYSEKNLILQQDIDTNISLTYHSVFSINQRTVLLYKLITKKSKVLP